MRPRSSSEKPQLLIMGMRRSGKSSIQSVVFQKMAPNETLFLESTAKVSQTEILSFIDFHILDFPGHVDMLDSGDQSSIFAHCGALIFVIDAQDEYIESLQRLYLTIVRAYRLNPTISFEVFIHKVDGLSDDNKIEIQREIHQRLTDELADIGLDTIPLGFHLTSIYDQSIFEAFSKVVQKLIPQLPTLENLLNILCSNSGIEKTFLFDMASKIYIATDSSPVDVQSYELCSRMIDVILDMTSIYAEDETKKVDNKQVDSVEPFGSIRLNNGMILYLRQVDKNLCLVSLMRDDAFEKYGIVDYNFRITCEAILSVT